MAAASSCVPPEAAASSMTPDGSGPREPRGGGWSRCSGRKAFPRSTPSSSPMPMPTTSTPCPISWPASASDGSSCPRAFWRVRPSVSPRCEGARRRGAFHCALCARGILSPSIRSVACGCCTRGRATPQPIPAETTTNRALCSPSNRPAAGCCSRAMSRASRSRGSCVRGPVRATCSWHPITAAARHYRPPWPRRPLPTGCSSAAWAVAAGRRFGSPTGRHRGATPPC